MFFHKKAKEKPEMLMRENILLNLPSEDHEAVIQRCGQMLVDSGYAGARYIEGMIARDRSFSTAIGNHIAIPHGENAYKPEIKATGLVVLTYPDGVEWNGDQVKLVIGMAALGDEHLEILGHIVEIASSGEDVDALVARADADEIHRAFTLGN